MHYYDSEGNPRHTVVGLNGNTRPTTVADARKLGLFPSVTTIMSVQSKDGLLNWLMDQLLQNAAALPYTDKYTYLEWKGIILDRSDAIRRDASDRGTEIHQALENYYLTGEIDRKEEVYIMPAIEFIDKEFNGVVWKAESRIKPIKGYGGSVDLHSSSIVLDFKTKNKNNIDKCMQYPDHKIQLAAYQDGLKLPNDTTRFNLFISTHEDTPGKVCLKECKQFDKHIKLFYALFNWWRIKNGYEGVTYEA